MAKTNRYAQIKYNKDEDRYELWISSDGGKTYDFSYGSHCVNRKGDDEGDEPMFIYTRFIEEIRRCIYLGYKFVEFYEMY